MSTSNSGWTSLFTPGRIILTVLLALVLAGGIGSCSLYGYANSTRTQGITQENGLVAQFNQNQNELSTGVTQIVEMMQVADVKKDAIKEVLSAAVQGRYGDKGFSANGALFAAVAEQYPTIDMSTYDRVVTKIESSREAFKGKQDKLQDMVRVYNTWRQDGIVRSYFAAKYFPSASLKVTVAGQTLERQAALDKISQLVLTTDSQEAFKTGTLKTLELKPKAK